jgi:hypothetical protein
MNSGQVGQESNWQPAVLEIAAACSISFHQVSLCAAFHHLAGLVFQSVPFRSTALLPKVLPQAACLRPAFALLCQGAGSTPVIPCTFVEH